MKMFLKIFCWLMYFLFTGWVYGDVLFSISFEKDLTVDVAKGKKELIEGKGNILEGEGLIAKGQNFKPLKFYTEGNINNEEGTIEFFYKPSFSFDKDEGLTIYRLFLIYGGPEKALTICINDNKGKKYIGLVLGDKEKGLTNYGIYNEVKVDKEKWHHIAAVWDRKTIGIYLDGILIGEKERKNADILLGEYFYIGGSPYSPPTNVVADGLIKDFKITDKRKYTTNIISSYLQNKINNGNFKTLTGWEIKNEGGAVSEYKLIETENDKSLYIKKINGTGNVKLISEIFKLEPDKPRLKIKGLIRVVDTKFKGYCIPAVEYFGEGGRKIKDDIPGMHIYGPLRITPDRQWDKIIYVSNIPKDAKKARIFFLITGNPSEIIFDDILVTDFYYNEYNFKGEEQEELKYTKEEVNKFLEKRKNAEAEIKSENGTPILYIEGKKTPPIFYLKQYPDRLFQGFVKEFSEAGIKVVVCSIPLGRQVWLPYEKYRSWLGENQYNFSIIDEYIYRVLQADPEVYIILGLYIEPYIGWAEKNPEEIIVRKDGEKAFGQGCKYFKGFSNDPIDNKTHFRPPSYYSEVYQRDVRNCLVNLLEYIKHQSYYKTIIGFGLFGGDDGQFLITPLQGDYSKGSQKAFGKYLKEKYGTIDNLEKSWNIKDLEFSSISFPDLFLAKTFFDPTKDRPSTDFWEYMNKALAEYLNSIGELIKEKAGKKVINITYYSDLLHGHGVARYAARVLNNGKGIDIMVVPEEYHTWRKPGRVGGSVNNALLSRKLHNKIYLNEMDYRTWKTYYTDDMISLNYVAPAIDIKEFSSMIKKGLMFQIPYGGGAWYYDMSGGWFHDEEIMKEIKVTTEAIKRIYGKPNKFKPDVLVVVDEESAYYVSHGENYAAFYDTIQAVLPENREAFYSSGVPFDIVNADDLVDYNLSDYKVYFFMNFYYGREKIKKFINEKLKKDNKLLVWIYAPGIISENGISLTNIENLTGIRVNNQSGGARGYVVSDISHPITSKIDKNVVLGTGGYVVKEDFVSRINIEDDSIIPLAYYIDNKKVAIGLKEFKNYRSLYIAQPTLSPELINGIADFGGAHVVTSPGAGIVLTDNFLGVHEMSKGTRCFKLKGTYSVYDLITGKMIKEKCKEFSCEIPTRDTVFFYLKKRD